MNENQPPEYSDKQAEMEKENDDLPTYPQNPTQFEGYQNLGFCTISDPIDLNNVPQDPNVTRPDFKNVQFLTEDEAREALAKFVSEHCCYGSGPLKNLTITEIKSSHTYRYILETFTETRLTQYVSEPYFGQPIINTGVPPPQPWQIPVHPSALFQDQETKIEIPNTAHVENLTKKNCPKCCGVGTRICYVCTGRGRRTCWICNGRGYKYENGHRHSCHSCFGSGFTGCLTCSRSGRVICNNCKGGGRLKWFLQLAVKFVNNKEDYFKKSEIIPDDLLRKCLAKNTFSEQNSRLYPINHHNDQDVNQASVDLLNKHFGQFNHQSRVLAQRHEVNSIPVSLARYKFNEKMYTYHIYGMEGKVYAPDYPRKCLCCTIL